MHNVQIIHYLSLSKSNIMKKLFVLFAAVTLFIGVQGCKQKAPEEQTETVTEEVVNTTTDTLTQSVEDTGRLPKTPPDPIRQQ